MKRLLYYGLQRSGTGFLETVLKKRYRVRFLNSNEDRASPLQKHFRLYHDKDTIPEPQYLNDLRISNLRDQEQALEVIPSNYLIVFRDPYSWLLSYYRWARRCKWPKVRHRYLAEYNLFYAKQLGLSRRSDRIIFIKYIDLVRDVGAELGRLKSAMHLRKRRLHGHRGGAVRKVSQSDRLSTAKRDYYLHEQYLDEYSETELRSVDDLVDSSVMSMLGYVKRVG